MQLALISPISMLHLNVTRELQMMLPSLTYDDVYNNHYIYLCKHPGCYVILDNGMFEGGKLDNIELLAMAKSYGVNEIVAPDVRGDAEESLALQREFFHLYRAAYSLSDHPPTVMAVVQGRFLKEMHQHIDGIYQHLHPQRNIVIGLPRRLTEGMGKITRHELCEYITNVYGPMYPIHLLGLSRSNPREVQAIARDFGDYVRGVDTSAPFVWTLAQKHLDKGEIADREGDYFGVSANQFRGDLLRHNISTLEAWCRGE
jgi:hypothetical protein